MLKQKPVRAQWWILNLLMVAAMGLLFFEARLSVGVTIHRLIEFGIVLLLYSLISLWLQANSQGILFEDQDQQSGSTRKLYTSAYYEPRNPVLHSFMETTRNEPAPDHPDHRA